MRKMFVIVSVVVILASLWGCRKISAKDDSWTKVQEKGTLVLGFNTTFPPMGFEEYGIYQGFDIDMAREVTDRLGLELVLYPLVWDVKEKELINNNIDCIWDGFSITPERQAMLTFSNPYMKNQQVLVVIESSPLYRLEDLSGKGIGVQRNSSSAHALNIRPQIKDILKEVRQYEDNLLAMADMEMGNIDAVLLDKVLVQYTYTRHGYDRYRMLDVVIEDEEFAVGFRKQDIALRDQIQQSIDEMFADGTMDALAEKWFGTTEGLIR